MKALFRAAALSTVLAGAMFAATNADAQIGIHIGVPGLHIGIGVPAYYYGRGYFPPGPCDAYDHYYDGDCGYSVYTGPVYFDGVLVNGPHYYRWYGDHPVFWYRGGWHEWGGWRTTRFGWVHNEGYGWHNGHWDRDWGRAHWHDMREDRHDDHMQMREEHHDTNMQMREDHHDTNMQMREDHHDDRMHDDHGHDNQH